ncbi:ATP-binding protein [Glycomyces sp. L485]|uniref:ATP-binding protein n=1 Tax=Glycomyces sp. L485 TaxID=2909235 RepID=UPI001F4A2D6A|nr:ATP-binding protein [Glycomyces sp. L485]MCH7231114.1 ATP-binding protein [Glycomyces sp. L485]
MRFLNRTYELQLLRERVQSDRADFLVVYGRRRVGKTELLNRLADEVRSLVFEGSETTETDQLAAFAAELALAEGADPATAEPLPSWRAALDRLSEFVGAQRTLVVLDEFQFLARQSKGLESLINIWWRKSGRHLPITFIVSGSEVSFFEDEVLAGTMYGRRTGQLKLEPFGVPDAALFHPAYSFEDRIRTYSVCGGIPYYLDRFTDDAPVAEHLLSEVLRPTGFLRNEGELLLRQSLANPAHYIAILKSIAQGHNRNSAIADRTGLEPSAISKALRVLERLGLVEEMKPITAPIGSKKTAYRIADQFMRFHFRFVDPSSGRLGTDLLARNYLEHSVLPAFDHFVSETWEEICQDYTLRRETGLYKVGRWWGKVPTGEGRRVEMREIDVAGVDHDGRAAVVGMCKWTNFEVDFDELNLLDRLIPHIERRVDSPVRYLFSRSGFTERLRKHAENDTQLNLVTPADIYR